MGVYYPQAAMTLRVIWEDFNVISNAAAQKVYSLDVVAKSVTVNINDYTQADTFSAEIDYKNFPFDPRTIRSCGVTIHMENTEVLATGAVSELKPTKANTIFAGFADEESLSFDDSNRVVRFEGRDFTSLLIDKKFTDGLKDMGAPIDSLISGLLADNVDTNKIVLDNRTGETSLPVLKLFSDTSNTTKLGGQRSQKRGESYWDVIQDLAARAGLIAYIEVDKLVLSKPRALYSAKHAKKFIYGRNVSNLEFKRQIGRKKNFNVRVISLPTGAKEIITADIPAESTLEWSQETGIPQKQVTIPQINPDGSKGTDQVAPTLAFRVPEINDKDHLVKIGQEIYEEMGRQQMEGSFSTKDMETDDGSLSCFDLLGLRVGMPLDIKIGVNDWAGFSEQKTTAARVKFLTDRCYDVQVAQILATIKGDSKFNPLFYTRSVNYTLDAQNGFNMKVDFINFIDLPKRLGGNG